ncbi:MAG: hypothetical protein HQL86_03075 [Magnetococcales bacterium]|nr:hypothetical protein [Magnetococcales bacterium]
MATTPEWPATLPPILLDGFSLTFPTETIRSDMEAGPSQVRRISSSNPDVYSCGWVMSQAQFSTFRSWFSDADNGINGGAAWFSFTGPVGSVVGRFRSAPTAARVGLHWKVSGDLEVLPA